MDKLISVIVPVFNVELYLERCVQSLLNQTSNKLEIILVDVFSKVSSPALCDKLAELDCRIKVIHKPINEGLGFARNTGIENASGDYIMFLDSDDYLDLNTCEAVKNALEENSADICCFLSAQVYKDETIYDRPFYEPLVFEGEEIASEFLTGTLAPKENESKFEMGLGISSCMAIYKAELMKDNPLRFFSEREFLNEDMLFRIELCKYINKAVVLSDNFYYYFHNSGTLTTKYKPNRFEESLKVYEKAGELLNSFSCEELCRRNERYFLINALVSIKQEVAQNGFSAIKTIKSICKNEVLREVISRYPIDALPRAQKVFYKLIKAKAVFTVFVLTKIKLLTENKTMP